MIETLAVLVGPLIVVGMLLYVYVKSNTDDIKDNWVQYRCNPIYMPFAGMFSSNVGVFENFSFCVSSFTGQFFSYALAPIHLLFKMFTQTIQIVLDQLNVFRAYIAGMQNFIASFFASTLGRVSNTFGVVVRLLSTLRDLTNRIVASGAYSAIIMSTGVNFLMSLFSFVWTLLKTLVGLIFGLAIILMFVFPPLLFFFIPIGIAIGVSYDGGCFHPETPVVLANGRTLPISEVKAGDVLVNNAVVKATMRFTPTDKLYVYRSTVRVSGSHVVRDSDGVWRKVENSFNSVAYEGPTPSEIVCLSTSNHRIHIQGCIFADYDEVSSGDECGLLHEDDTVRRRSDNELIKLKDCVPGMETDCGVLRCVMDMGGGMRQLIVENPLGKIQINDSTWVTDYLGAEHDRTVYDARHRRAMAELNRNLHNNDER